MIALLALALPLLADPGPTPAPYAESEEYSDIQGELAAWWEWCLRHSNVLVREDKRWAVYNAEGGWELPFMVKLKVVGPPPGRPPFASMWRFQTYTEFRHPETGELLGLRGQGFSYQTSASTDIGQGGFKRVVWPDEEDSE